MRNWGLYIYYALIMAIFAYAVYYHTTLICYNYQIELREVAIIETTDMVNQHENPFVFQNLPEKLNVYGIVYNYTAAPIISLFKTDSLITHRVLTALYILLSVVFLAFVQYKLGIKLFVIIGSSVLFYATYLTNVNIQPRPDSLGLLLFLIAVLYPLVRSYSYGSLAGSIILTILAFYTKIYFVLAAPVIVSYLFLFVSKKKAVYYALCFGILFGLSAIIVNHYCPAYFYVTVILSKLAGVYNIPTLLKQFRDYFLLEHPGYTILSLVVLYKFISSTAFKFQFKDTWQKISLLNIGKPLIPETNISIIAWAGICGFLVFALKLGGHHGSYLIYLLQLFVPFYIIAVNKQLTRLNISEKFVQVVILSSVITSLLMLGGLYTKQDTATFVKVEKEILSNKEVLSFPAFNSILYKNNYRIYDDGQVEYYKFLYTGIGPQSFYSKYFNKIWVAKKYCDAYTTLIQHKVQHKDFGLIYYHQRMKWMHIDSALAQNYYLADSVTVAFRHSYLTYDIQIWKPQNQSIKQ